MDSGSQPPVLNRFGDVLRGDGGTVSQIGNGSCGFEDGVISAAEIFKRLMLV